MSEHTLTGRKVLTTKVTVLVGLMGAISSILMLLELPGIAFLKIDFSDIPAILISMFYGPIPAVLVEFIKNLLKVLFGTKTAVIGEIANFLIGSAYVIPIGIGFRRMARNASFHLKNKILYFGLGTILMTVVGFIANLFFLIPFYAQFMGGEEAIVKFVQATIPAVQTKFDVVLMAVTPFNLGKGILLAIISIPLYNVFRKKI